MCIFTFIIYIYIYIYIYILRELLLFTQPTTFLQKNLLCTKALTAMMASHYIFGGNKSHDGNTPWSSIKHDASQRLSLARCFMTGKPQYWSRKAYTIFQCLEKGEKTIKNSIKLSNPWKKFEKNIKICVRDVKTHGIQNIITRAQQGKCVCVYLPMKLNWTLDSHIQTWD